jgi:hypothetical protein
MAGVVYCMFLHQGAFGGVGCRDICSVWFIVCFLHQGALSGVGCVERILFMHAVCSCIKVPLAVSGGRMHGRCGVLYVLASRCLLWCRVLDICSVFFVVWFLHQGALSGVGCVERFLFCQLCCVFLRQGALSGVGRKDAR